MRAPCALRMNVSFLIGQLLGGQVQASGAHATETGKEVIRRGNVFGDLRFEFFGARKLPFFAEALPETDFDVARREVAGIIEQVRFDSEARAVEGWAHADIGDAAMATGVAFKDGAGDVDAARGQQFLIGAKVESGESEFSPGARAADDFAGEREGAAEEFGGRADVTLRNKLAHQGTRNDLSIEDDGSVHHDFEAVTHAEFPKKFHVSGLAVAEAEIVADHHGADAQLADENLLHEFGRGERSKLRRERQDHRGFHANRPEPVHALLIRGNPQRRDVGLQYLEWRWFKSDRGGNGAGFFRARDGKLQDLLVADMDAVEIADGHDAPAARRGVAHGPVRGGVEDVDAGRRNMYVDSEGLGGTLDSRRFGGDLKPEAVVRELHVRVAEILQPLIGGLVGQIVRNVRKPGALRLQPIDERERLLDGLMHRVRNVAKRVEDKIVEVFEERNAGFREPAEVGQVRRAAEAEAEDVHFAVEKRDRDERDAQKRERAIDLVKFDAGDAAERGLVVKDIRENATEDAERVVGSVDWNGGFLAIAVRTKIVEAKNVVGVAMRKNDAVQAIDARAESLGAEIRGGVDDHILAVVREQQRRAKTLVPGIAGIADRAVAAERGDAHGGAGTEDREAQLGVVHRRHGGYCSG